MALTAWLGLLDEALLPVQTCAESMRRTEQRAVVLQLERLMGYPMVRREVEAGRLTLHGWHYVIEDGDVYVFDAQHGDFVAASIASNSGTGPYPSFVDHDGVHLPAVEPDETDAIASVGTVSPPHDRGVFR